MIELNTRDGVARLYNPTHIIEIGSYETSRLDADSIGSAREPSEGGADAERTSYIITTGGYDPVDIVQNETDVAYLMACWDRRRASCLEEMVLFVRLVVEGDARDVEFVCAGL